MSLACLLAVLASVSLLLQEVRVLFQPQRAEAGFYDHIASGSMQYAPSSYSRKLVLGDCSFALLNMSRAGGVDQQSALARSCEHISREIADAMPTNSQAWYVNALAHARLGDVGNFLSSYRRSRETGPNEQWIAENRARLAEDMFAQLDADSLAYHEADLTMLASSRRGTRTLAERYAADENFRERIINVVSRLPPERQRAFLNNVRRVVR
jgi:hypothetical protein